MASCPPHTLATLPTVDAGLVDLAEHHPRSGAVQRRHWRMRRSCVSPDPPNLLNRWRHEEGAVAVWGGDPVTGDDELRRLEERMRELERQSCT